jgi:hypothetical protein
MTMVRKFVMLRQYAREHYNQKNMNDHAESFRPIRWHTFIFDEKFAEATLFWLDCG